MKLGRRDMLILSGGGCAGLALGAGGLCTMGGHASEQPVVLAPLGDLTPGVMQAFPEHAVVAIRTDQGIAVISTRCTHLGCNLRIVGDQLVCPCHGGRYSRDGQVIAGPPPRSLPWLACGIDAGGRVVFHPGLEQRDRRPCPLEEPGE